MNRADLAFPSMGGEARVRLESRSLDASALERLAQATRARIDAIEAGLSRFRPGSELNALNADPRAAVPVSSLLRETVAAARWAAERSDGLVDATLLGELERHGYQASWDPARRADVDEALAAPPPPPPAGPPPRRGPAPPPRRRAGPAAWRVADRLRIDEHGRVARPPGVRLDPGGLAKGIAADLAGA